MHIIILNEIQTVHYLWAVFTYIFKNIFDKERKIIYDKLDKHKNHKKG